ncbi:1301_t:CDS:1, partial [Funneliformis geosporum]
MPQAIFQMQVALCVKKYHIGMKRYKDIINNQMPSEPTEKWKSITKSIYSSHKNDWDKEIENIYVLYAELP